MKFLIVIAAGLLLFILPAQAQLRFDNQSSLLLGNLPGSTDKSRTVWHNQFTVQAGPGNWNGQLRLENFNFGAADEQYTHLAQFRLGYQNQIWQAEAGHFYESLGQGLLLRTYELPGVVYEDLASRRQYGFQKDLLGSRIALFQQHWSAKILWGRPLNRLVPPGEKFSDRRPVTLTAGQAETSFDFPLNGGLMVLNAAETTKQQSYGGFFTRINLPLAGDAYLEYVQNAGDDFRFKDLSRNFAGESSHGFYFALSGGRGPLSYSLEYKDYHDLTLNYNDPPNLVHEHSYTLLNRTTHVIETLDERGFQAEALLALPGENLATINHSTAVSQIAGVTSRFEEYFIETEHPWGHSNTMRLFFDFLQENQAFQKKQNQFTAGLSTTAALTAGWSWQGQYEWQQFRRLYQFNSSLNHNTANHFFSFGVTRSQAWSFSVSSEFSNDPLETDRLSTEGLKDRIITVWPAAHIKGSLGENHELRLFWGERRGGTACTGGICYEVQPFNGVEMTLISHF